VFRARTDAVSVNVSVKRGRVPVTGLSTTDFTLTDNGVTQTVDALTLERVPIDLSLVMTRPEGPYREAREAYFRALRSASSVRKSLLAHDRLRLVSVDAAILGRVLGNEESLLAREIEIQDGIGVSVIDGLYYAIAWPVEPDRRHLIVAFTNGWDRSSVLEKKMLPRLAAHSDAVLHVVFWAKPGADMVGIGYNTSSSPPLLTPWQDGHDAVVEAAQRTGGAVHNATDALQDLAAIIEDFRTSYVLQYTPRGVPSPGWHEIRVRLTRPGKFDIRARKGYEVRN
jgi:hypothetical protein